MWPKLALASGVALPAVLLRLLGVELPPEVTVLVFGAGVVASAVLLAWAAEAAQVDIPILFLRSGRCSKQATAICLKAS